MAHKDFTLLRHELQKLPALPPWGRPQGDNWDRLSNFIYRATTLQEVQRLAQGQAQAQKLDPAAFEAYAVRRWYNQQTHDQILQMFLAHPTVTPEENKKHHAIDFYLRGLPFDLKISRFPRAYPQSIHEAQQNPRHLVAWQYRHQSKQGRYHLGNRLFIILHHARRPEQTWQLRRNFDALAARIVDFLDSPTLLGLKITHQHTQKNHLPWSAVIFYVKD